MNKEKEGTNVKETYEFDNDPMKVCFEHIKQKCHIDLVIFYGTFFVMIFLCLGMHIFFSSFIVICTHLKCYTTSDVQLITCALCEKKRLKELVDKKMKNILFSSMFFLCSFFGLKIILMCFDKLIKFYASHHYRITFEPYDINPFVLL